LTAPDLLQLGIIDGIIPEPLGGAHRDPGQAAREIKKTIEETLEELSGLTADELLEARYNKFRKMGVYKE
jgi:acetyl-CoA carboxylase carboxyl transferase subunit alpha